MEVAQRGRGLTPIQRVKCVCLIVKLLPTWLLESWQIGPGPPIPPPGKRFRYFSGKTGQCKRKYLSVLAFYHPSMKTTGLPPQHPMVRPLNSPVHPPPPNRASPKLFRVLLLNIKGTKGYPTCDESLEPKR